MTMTERQPRMIPNPLYCERCDGYRYRVIDAEWEPLEANGARTIIVETASRFARVLMVQEVGYASAASI